MCEIPADLKKAYQDVYPLCQGCKTKKHIWHKKRPRPGCDGAGPNKKKKSLWFVNSHSLGEKGH